VFEALPLQTLCQTLSELARAISSFSPRIGKAGTAGSDLWWVVCLRPALIVWLSVEDDCAIDCTTRQP